MFEGSEVKGRPELEVLRFKKGEKILLETDISPMLVWQGQKWGYGSIGSR